MTTALPAVVVVSWAVVVAENTEPNAFVAIASACAVVSTVVLVVNTISAWRDRLKASHDREVAAKERAEGGLDRAQINEHLDRQDEAIEDKGPTVNVDLGDAAPDVKIALDEAAEKAAEQTPDESDGTAAK